MVQLTSDQLYALIAAFLWPLARILALLSVAPVLGNQGLPVRVRVGLGVALTFVVAPVIGPLPAVEPWSGAGLAILAQQIAIGLAIGFVMRIAFAAVDMAGELAGLQMGLGFATFFDPHNASASPVLAQFFGLLAALVFLAANGHLMLVSALVESFRALPPGSALDAGALQGLLGWAGTIFLAGLMLALPVIAALLVANLALGVLTRAAPQLNLFAVGFPVTLLIGFAVIALSLPHATPGLLGLFEEGFRVIGALLRSAGP